LPRTALARKPLRMLVRSAAAAILLLATLASAWALDRNTVEIASKSGVHVFAVEIAKSAR